MAWQKKTSVVAQGVTTVAMPWLLPRVLKLGSFASGRKFGSNLSTTLKASHATEYITGINAIEKIIATEGQSIG